MTLIDTVKYDPYFDPTETRRFNDRLYRKPAFLTPDEKALDRRLRTHMIRHVRPYVKSKHALDALKAYVREMSLYEQFTRYAFNPKKYKKPWGFDACQRILTSSNPLLGAREDLTLYRCISRREMDGAFHMSDEWLRDQGHFGSDERIETADSIFFINRNVSTSISPIAAIRFLGPKDPGPKCCMLVFKIPKGYPTIYMPGLFSDNLTEREREIFLPSGEYYVEELGYEVKIHLKTLGISPHDMEKPGWSKIKGFAMMQVLVVRPLARYSPFITGPKSLHDISYLRTQMAYEKALSKKKVFAEKTAKTDEAAKKKTISGKKTEKKKKTTTKTKTAVDRKIEEILRKLKAIYGYRVKAVKA